jgi:hypothetical protein
MLDVSADCVGPQLLKMSQRKKAPTRFPAPSGPFRFSFGAPKA